jgi:hypothetical protein
VFREHAVEESTHFDMALGHHIHGTQHSILAVDLARAAPGQVGTIGLVVVEVANHEGVASGILALVECQPHRIGVERVAFSIVVEDQDGAARNKLAVDAILAPRNGRRKTKQKIDVFFIGK